MGSLTTRRVGTLGVFVRRFAPGGEARSQPASPAGHIDPRAVDIGGGRRCACETSTRHADAAVWAFINHHLQPVARLSSTDTAWLCSATQVRWRLVARDGGRLELVREDVPAEATPA